MARSKKAIIAPEASRKSNKFQELHESEKTDQAEPQSHLARLSRVELRNKFISVADQLAQSVDYSRNHKYKGADKAFPLLIDVDQRIVSKFYPNALGGPLLVDEPKTELQLIKAQEKHIVLKQLGFRHVIVTSDSEYLQCLEQLESA